ncbi:MAG: ABC transporter permease subunit [Planctomycetota bacterium]|nr:ABC transporter permease subunit [Planctomycetota bacterium]
MPIHDLGYRAWNGELTSPLLRWWTLAHTGIRLAWRSPWLRRILILAWTPLLYFGATFFVYEYAVVQDSAGMGGANLMRSIGFIPDEVVESVAKDPVEARPQVWAYLLLNFFRAPQAILMVLMVGLIAPGMIGGDLRTRAFLLYFARPITEIEYLAGKATVVCFYVFLITTLPALVIYSVGIALSPSLSVLLDTWHLPFRILIGSVVLMLPTTMLALAFSSLTTESRYAGFAWFAVWVLGWVAYLLLLQLDRTWPLLSLFHTVGVVQSWIFGFGDLPINPMIPSLLLALLTGASFCVLYRRISAPMRT